jgi:hypothetical protein
MFGVTHIDMRRVVESLVTLAVQAAPAGAINDAVKGPPAVPPPPFRPGFMWTCTFKEQYANEADERQPLVLEVVKPSVVVRRVEVNKCCAQQNHDEKAPLKSFEEEICKAKI